jgi:hypothetical protein
MAAGGLPSYLRPADASDFNIYVTIETVPNDKFKQLATEVDPFLMGKWLKLWFPGTEEARPIKGGKLLVAAKTEKIVENAITNATDLYERCAIKITRMDSMNRAEGTIFAKELLQTSIETIVENLKPAGVINIERIETMQNGKPTPNGVHILIFEKKPLPENIIIGYMRYDVRQFYPRPLRCGGCCLLGHSRGKCPTKFEACRLCAGPRHQGICTAPKKCVNCQPPNDGHGSYEKVCPELAKQTAITKLKVDLDISYSQAKRQVEKQVACGEKSFAQTVKEATTSSVEETNETPNKEHQSVCAQLDRTRQQRIDAERILEELQLENEKLTETLAKIRRIKKDNEVLRRQIAAEQEDMETDLSTLDLTEYEEQTRTPATFITTQTTGEQATTTPNETKPPSKGAISKQKRPSNEQAGPSLMTLDPHEAVRRPRTGSSDEEVQPKHKAVMDVEDRPQKAVDGYDVEPDSFSKLSRGLRKKLVNLVHEREKNEEKPALYRKVGSELVTREPYTRTDMTRAENLRQFILKYRPNPVTTPPPTPTPPKEK